MPAMAIIASLCRHFYILKCSSSNSHEGLVPKLRFPEFQGEWTSSKLGEIGTFTKGATLSKADISDEGTPFILYGELYTTYGEVTYNVVRKTDKTANEVHYSQIGDVIIPTSGETPEEIATSTCVMCSGVILAGDLNIYRTSVVDGRIVSFIINHVINDKIAKVAQGKSVVHVKADEIAKMTINYPTPQEQSKILTLLELIEFRISKQRALIERLKSYKRGVIQEIFGQSHEWKNYALYEIGEIRTGTTPSTSISEYYGDKYLWVTPSDIENKEITTTCKKLSELGLSKGRVIPANSVLVTCIASIGKNAVLRQKGSCNQQINAITPFSEFDLDFIYYGICYNESQMHAKAGTGGMKILNKQAFSEIQIKCPKLAEQEKIAKMLSHIDNLLLKHYYLLDALAKLKCTLMSKMFI